MSARAHAPGSPPVWLTSFMGRQAELARIGESLGRTRLLTLTGAGGSGKTRLAAHLVGAESIRFADGSRWVDVAPITDPAQVVEQVAAAAGVVMRPGAGAVRLLASQLANQSLLLCVDNCGHVRDAVADVACELLIFCPGLSVLATSREPLRLDGETVWTVPTQPADDSIALFLERGRQVRPGFDADPAASLAVMTPCARLGPNLAATRRVFALRPVLSSSRALAR
ncbi:MAG: hypothetical protein ACLP0J_16370 [Solirubrobacteraceae bacterium]